MKRNSYPLSNSLPKSLLFMSYSLRSHELHHGSLFITISLNLLKLMSIESVMLSNQVILCCPLLPRGNHCLLFIILININTYIGIFSPPHTDGLVLHIIFCFHCLLNEQYLEDFFHMPWVTLPCSFSQMHRNPLYCVTVYITASN